MATKRERSELNRHWLRKWFRGEPHFVIGDPERPYLLRWFVLPRNAVLNIYLHKFLRSDDDRALHDHPWWFVSLVLRGGYWEHREGVLLSSRSWRSAGSFAVRPAKTLHRVELEAYCACPGATGAVSEPVCAERPCWTLVFTGPKIRNWGFKCPKGWVPWEYFDSANGCGEFS